MNEQSENLTHNEGTLRQVYGALYDNGIDEGHARDIVNSLQNRGVLFRERSVQAEDLEAIATPEQELHGWWVQTAKAEIEPMLAKMREYGGLGRAIDLEEIGRGLVQSGVRTPAMEYGQPALSHELQELGIYFYLLGKFARWTAAVAEGRPVSDDTLHDIGVYVRMAQRVRAVGGWPV